MFKSHLTIFIRKSIRNRMYTFTNLAGLTLGITSVMFILIWTFHETSYDRFHPEANHIYRLGVNNLQGTGILMQPGFAYALKNDIPYIAGAQRLETKGTRYFSTDQVSDYEKGIISADPGFFDFFGFELLKGNKEKALTGVNNIVISKSIAMKYFSTENVVGNNILINDKSFNVSGVVEDNLGNSHITFNAVIPNNINETDKDAWGWSMYFTFFKTSGPVSNTILSHDLNKLASQYIENVEEGGKQYIAQKLIDLHLHSNIKGHTWEAGNGDIIYVYIFLSIAVIILIVAWLNQINLSVAYSLKGAKDQGVRKLNGASKGQLMLQYLSESLISSFIAVFFAVILIELTMPLFNQVVGKDLYFTLWDTQNAIIVCGLAVITGLVTGVYPVFFLSSASTTDTLLPSSKFSLTNRPFISKALIVFQFIITSTLIIGTVVITKQLSYIKVKKLGFEKEQLLTVYLPARNMTNSEAVAIRNEIESIAMVKSVTQGSLPFMHMSTSVHPEGSLLNDEGVRCNVAYVDYAFLETTGINLMEGQNFRPNVSEDSISSAIINNEAVKHFGWTNPIGKYIKLNVYDNSVGRSIEKTMYVVGVTENFHNQSLKDPIGPLMMLVSIQERPYSLTIRFGKGDISGLLSNIENVWEKTITDRPFAFRFVDDYIESLYHSEQRFANIFNYFSFIALILAIIGLTGTFSYVAKGRRKEIGLRKVFGAPISNILSLLLKDFFFLIVVASIIAFPIAYYITGLWLRNFSYQVNVGVLLIYVISVMALLLVAFTSIGYQALKAAVEKPTETLRD